MSIRSFVGRNSKAFWHCSITDIDLVQNNFITIRFALKSSDRLSRTFIGQIIITIINNNNNSTLSTFAQHIAVIKQLVDGSNIQQQQQ